MKTIAVIVILVIVAAVGGYVYSIRARLAEQDQTILDQGRSIGILATANEAKEAAITDLRDSKKRDDTIVTDTAERIETLSIHIDSLTRKAQEALRNEPHLTLDSVLPPAAADALCMQWIEASGRGDHSAANDQANASIGTDEGAKNPTPLECGRWRGMTVRDAVEWNSQLLKHAGLEREDKAALRRWADEAGK